jgi:AcrR family transcriptional regulator
MCENVSVTRNRGYHHGNLRAALIEAGLKLIEEKGVPALTLREIGTRLGVSRMAAYRHFASKADLLAAISEAGFSRFADALEEARRKARGNSASRLSAMALAYVRFASEHRAYYEVMFGSAPESRPGGGSAERAFGILEQTIRQGQQAGEIREDNSVLLARLVWAAVHGISTLRLATDLGPRGQGTQFVRFCSEVLQTGLAACGSARPARKHQ